MNYQRDLHYGTKTYIFPAPTLRKASGTLRASWAVLSPPDSGQFLTLQKCCLQQQYLTLQLSDSYETVFDGTYWYLNFPIKYLE